MQNETDQPGPPAVKVHALEVRGHVRTGHGPLGILPGGPGK